MIPISTKNKKIATGQTVAGEGAEQSQERGVHRNWEKAGDATGGSGEGLRGLSRCR